MSKFYFAAFAMVSGIAVGAVDYINQAKLADQKPGQFEFGAYAATISGRFVDQKQAADAAAMRRELLATAPRDFLPEAADGWIRRPWAEADEALLDPRYDMANDAMIPDELKQDPTLQALSAMDRSASARRDAREVYVYEGADAMIALRVQVLPKDGGAGLAGFAAQLAANNIEAMSGKEGFAVVRGVTFREELGLFGTEATERAFRVFTGEIGGRVRVTARSRADEATILTLLDQIDYDRLNLLLDTPTPGIGSAAPEIDPAEARALAEESVTAAAAAQRQQAIDQERHIQAAALELGYKMGSISEEDYRKAKAGTDAQQSSLDAANDGMIPAPATNDAAQVAPTVVAASEGGLWSMIKNAIGAGGNGPQKGSVMVKVNTLGAKNCTFAGSSKRCSINGN